MAIMILDPFPQEMVWTNPLTNGSQCTRSPVLNNSYRVHIKQNVFRCVAIMIRDIKSVCIVVSCIWYVSREGKWYFFYHYWVLLITWASSHHPMRHTQYLHVLSFLDYTMTVEILPRSRKKPLYPTQLILWLMMTRWYTPIALVVKKYSNLCTGGVGYLISMYITPTHKITAC